MSLGEKLEGGRRIDTETGLIMPWYTSPCLEWLLTLDLKGKLIFEYGVGDSTLWYWAKEAHVLGVDSNKEWAQKIDCWLARTKWDYISIIGDPNTYDIVVIDGDYRDECTEFALKALKPGGYLIIDNYKQPSVEEHWPLTEKLIEGMPITVYKEPDHYDWVTAVVTKP
jgi:predicted O-methyltransferase YrrM